MRPRFDTILFFERSRQTDQILGRDEKGYVVIPDKDAIFRPNLFELWLGLLIPSSNRKFYWFKPIRKVGDLYKRGDKVDDKEDSKSI